MITWNARFALVALLLASTGLFQHMRAGNVAAPPRISLASFPLELGKWVGSDIPIAPIILNTLDRGVFLQREYQDQNTKGPGVSLYLAYFPNQQAGRRRHLPEDCLAGSGLVNAGIRGVTTLSLPGYKPLPRQSLSDHEGDPTANSFSFWFWGRGRGVASEDWAELLSGI